MERLLRTIEVDGHSVAVIEMVDEDRSWILVAVDETVINEGSPLPTDADDDVVRAVVHGWMERS